MPCKCKDTNEAVLAALGAIRQDVRAIMASLCRLEGNGFPVPPEGPSGGLSVETVAEDWKKRANEAWERHLQERRSKNGLATGDEVTESDLEEYMEGWAR